MAAGILSGGVPTRVRYNSQDWWKYINVGDPIVAPGHASMHFPEYWDADLRSYVYLSEFLVKYGGLGGSGKPIWKELFDTYAMTMGIDLTSPHLLPNAALIMEIQGILTVALDREDRFLEIIDQHEAEGAISYFSGMLMASPAQYPKTNLLIHVARRVGEYIVMCLKEDYRCPRPSQLCAGIVPLIDPPTTPSYPSGHSLQAQLIYQCLTLANPPMEPGHLIKDLADRIGKNRIIAGVHFPKDHSIGQAAADWCVGLLKTGPLFSALVSGANAELRQ
jgi:hypothetical protein